MEMRANQEAQESEEKAVLAALEDPKWEFRTVDGIATTTGVSAAKVEDILNRRREWVRESNIRDEKGRRLFTLRSRPKTWREILAELRAIVTRTS
jgi:hypothetical protein